MEPMEGAPEVRSGRQATRAARSRRQRRFLAALLAVVGLSAVAAAVMFRPDSEPAGTARTAGSTTGADVETEDGAIEPKPASDAPGGVGKDPEKTGLPAKPAEGGKVRTGTAEEGCFESVREYLEEWHRTEKEPEPCFTTQPASNQDQPDGVQRTYNGEEF